MGISTINGELFIHLNFTFAKINTNVSGYN